MRDEAEQFEQDVRRIARLRWPGAEGGGAVIEDNRERDGIFITEDLVVVIECTLSRRKQKAEQDIRKLAGLVKLYQERYPTRAVKGYFVTRDEPTADQRSVANQHRPSIAAISFEELKRPLIDALGYLSLRENYPFGSMRDPKTGKALASLEYIEPNIVTESRESWPIRSIATALQEGHSFVLLGDYGIGKSTAMREVFRLLAQDYRRRTTRRFPILLNLRDHHGETDVAEALERHARRIGYSTPAHLVRTWRAGDAILLLDGFDEMAISGWSGQAERLRQLRYLSMELLRSFVKENPSSSGLAITGRKNYFDSLEEMKRALALNHSFKYLRIEDFTDEQIQTYLTKNNWTGSIPAWLPSRPLLLGYLAAATLLDAVANIGDRVAPSEGWHQLLDKVCDREAEMEVGVDGPTIRLIIERLASRARRSSGGLGPLPAGDIEQAYKHVTRAAPDTRAHLLLQRLPGLAPSREEDGARDFIDKDLVDAARAGDVYRFIQQRVGDDLESPAEWQTTIGDLGSQVVAYRCEKEGFRAPDLALAVYEASKDTDYRTLSADILQAMKGLGFSYVGNPIAILGVEVLDAVFGDEGEEFSRITFHECIFHRLEIPRGASTQRLPRFADCYVGLLEGRTSRGDLPPGVFDDKCVIDAFGESSANPSAILELDTLELGVRVLLTILRKLYLQPGSARLPSAFYRGLEQRARALVPGVLAIVRQEGLANENQVGTRVYWVPNRSETARVGRIIAAPHESKDPVLLKAARVR